MKKKDVKKHNEEVKMKLDQISESLSDPFEADYIDEDTELTLQQLRKEQLDIWFRITQSNMKILFDLKKRGLLKGEDNHSRKINENLEAIGWGNAKEVKDIGEDTLDPTSPIYMLKEMYDIDSMIQKRAEVEIKRAIKALDAYCETHGKDKSPEVTYLDVNSNVYYLYEAGLKDSGLKDQAKRDITDIGALRIEYNEIKSGLRSCGGSFKKDEYLQPFVKEIIDRAIVLGYIAGINANTTQLLRKMDESNRNNTDTDEK